MKKTIKQSLRFIEVANQYMALQKAAEDRRRIERRSDIVRKNGSTPELEPERRQHAARNKFEYAINKMISRISNLLADEGGYNERVHDIRTDHASVDADKNIMYDAAGNIKFTIENQKLVNTEIRDLEMILIEIEPYIPSQIPDDLSEIIVEAFKGFVLKEDYELPEPGDEIIHNVVSENKIEK